MKSARWISWFHFVLRWCWENLYWWKWTKHCRCDHFWSSTNSPKLFQIAECPFWDKWTFLVYKAFCFYNVGKTVCFRYHMLRMDVMVVFRIREREDFLLWDSFWGVCNSWWWRRSWFPLVWSIVRAIKCVSFIR